MWLNLISLPGYANLISSRFLVMATTGIVAGLGLRQRQKVGLCAGTYRGRIEHFRLALWHHRGHCACHFPATRKATLYLSIRQN
jgi:hypothetical protein